MTHLGSSVTSRTLTIVLSESEWQALRAIEPDAVGWLREQIRERLGTRVSQEAKPGGAFTAASTAASAWGDDEY